MYRLIHKNSVEPSRSFTDPNNEFRSKKLAQETRDAFNTVYERTMPEWKCIVGKFDCDGYHFIKEV